MNRERGIWNWATVILLPLNVSTVLFCVSEEATAPVGPYKGKTHVAIFTVTKVERDPENKVDPRDPVGALVGSFLVTLKAEPRLPNDLAASSFEIRCQRILSCPGDLPEDAWPLLELNPGIKLVAAFDKIPKTPRDFEFLAVPPEPIDVAWKGVLEFERIHSLPANQLRDALAAAVKEGAPRLSGLILDLTFVFKPELLDDQEVIMPLLVQQVGNSKGFMALRQGAFRWLLSALEPNQDKSSLSALHSAYVRYILDVYDDPEIRPDVGGILDLYLELFYGKDLRPKPGFGPVFSNEVRKRLLAISEQAEPWLSDVEVKKKLVRVFGADH